MVKQAGNCIRKLEKDVSPMSGGRVKGKDHSLPGEAGECAVDVSGER